MTRSICLFSPLFVNKILILKKEKEKEREMVMYIYKLLKEQRVSGRKTERGGIDELLAIR
jgi:hypothetical protein